MLKGVILIIGFSIFLICLAISSGYNDEYQRCRRYPYYKYKPDIECKSVLWFGIGVIILYLTKLIMENI